MPTKSIFKNVTIDDIERFVSALEKAEGERGNRIHQEIESLW